MQARDAPAARNVQSVGGLAAALAALRRSRLVGDAAFAAPGFGLPRCSAKRGVAATPTSTATSSCLQARRAAIVVGAAAAAVAALRRSSGRPARTAAAVASVDKSAANGRPSGTSRRFASIEAAPSLVADVGADVVATGKGVAGRRLSGASRSSSKEELATEVNTDGGPQGACWVGIDFKSWLRSAEETVQVDSLRVEGALPAWLRGSLVQVGPAKFEFGKDELNAWPDGQAMLYRIRIKESGVCEYTNKWLDTANHKANREAGSVAARETCSRPSLESFWERVAYMFQPLDNENSNTHVSQFAGNARCISMSDATAPMEFKLEDLSTVGKVDFQDDLSRMGPLILHSEPSVDYVTGEWFTCALQLKVSPADMGLKSEYVVFSIPPDVAGEPGAPVGRREVARIRTDHPSPVHTIGITERYVVVIQSPNSLNWDGMLSAEGKWLLTGAYDGDLGDYTTWQPERATVIHLIDKATGERLPAFETGPFVFFHVINAWEEKGGAGGTHDCVFLDVPCFKEPQAGFPLREARGNDMQSWPLGGHQVKRFCLDLVAGECTWTGWPDNDFESPQVSPKVSGRRHRFSYGTVVDEDAGTLRIAKLDHDSHEVVRWTGQDLSRELPWMPVFVTEPYSDQEDAGALLSFVRDQRTGDSFCVVLDTETMEEHARIHIPKGHHIPMHAHGTWMQGQL